MEMERTSLHCLISLLTSLPLFLFDWTERRLPRSQSGMRLPPSIAPATRDALPSVLRSLLKHRRALIACERASETIIQAPELPPCRDSGGLSLAAELSVIPLTRFNAARLWKDVFSNIWVLEHLRSRTSLCWPNHSPKGPGQDRPSHQSQYPHENKLKNNLILSAEFTVNDISVSYSLFQDSPKLRDFMILVLQSINKLPVVSEDFFNKPSD